MTDLQIEDLPAGMSYEPVKGLAVGGIVARDMANHPVIRRPSRHFATCVFDPMADNTMLSMHLAQVEPGGYKCRHRHFDETTGYVVSGSGWGEYRQSDGADLIRFDWKAGDLIVTPCNSWHQHWNASDTDYARQLSFRNSRLMKEVVHGNSQAARAEKLYDQDARFYDRFADEPDYFTQREEIAPGVIRTNFVSQVADEPLPAPDPDWGDGVAMQHYVMGGQKMIDMVLIGIRPGGHMRAHRSLSEEGIVVLAGEGRTEIKDDAGRHEVIEWSAGDLISPPFNTVRSHHPAPGSEVRLLMARNVIVERALGLKMGTTAWLEALPVRFPDRVEAGR